MTTNDPKELLRLDILMRLSNAYDKKEWERFRLDYLLYKLHFPEDVKNLCDHMPGEARNQCLDILQRFDDESEK
jgi:hypothetical protein